MLFLRIDLDMHISGEFEMRLVVSSGAACIGLLGPFKTLSDDMLACLNQLAIIGDSGRAVMPEEVYFSWRIWICS